MLTAVHITTSKTDANQQPTKTLFPGIKFLGNFSVALSLVEPSVTDEGPLAIAGRVGDFNTF